MRACLAEGIGTFAMVFAGTGAIVVNADSGGVVTHVGIALTFGLVVMVIIQAIGDVSGAHINPAVTIGFWVAGHFPARKVLPYIGFQVTGALVASGFLKLLFPDSTTLGATVPAGSPFQSFVFEILLTGTLMFVILCVSTGSNEKGLMAGITIGAVVALEALFAGPVSGASMNPARSIGPAVLAWQPGTLGVLWLYIAAPVIGAVIAVPWCRWIQPVDSTTGDELADVAS
jgi:aquaporin Z